MKSRIIKGILSLILISALFAPLSRAEAATKTAVVDITNGVLNVRSGPGLDYRKIGKLTDHAKVAVYSINHGWAQIKYGKKKGYVSDEFLRIYSTMSSVSAKKIADNADKTERVTWKKNYTKSQIYSIMSSSFTKAYIDKYIKQQFRTAGKNNNGTQLYHIIETEIWGLALYPIDWKMQYEPKKAAIIHFVKNGKEYLYISQYHLNEESGNQTSTICFIKSGLRWLVFDHRVKYEN
ncbi:SH3 domain-containing protein [Bacillus sp. MUM 13]|uniref:SH3 domain-containing protein n=1 Tax=Bacillus sp. MUM 13 TaxID=1678001 RepID=UPI0008F562F4|nr:SH3 domain-containing protein [Bacillus sp. MUM 13]OIK11699.1 hypothetical protein BIV59_11745 [Bacillus sp. MUM 13]